jgi:hypothetical protein
MPESHLEKAIEENAKTAQSVSSEAGSATAHSLHDQIEADRYLRGVKAQRNGVSGLRILGRVGNSSG